MDVLGAFASYICLVYHEARNVRHLIAKNYRLPDRYVQLLSLPRNRDDAWAAMQACRLEASASPDANAAAAVFERRFAVSLDQLEDLYDDPHWKNAGAAGGYPWLRITKSVVTLGQAINAADAALAAELLLQLRSMRHNTGTLGEKLEGVDRGLRLKGRLGAAD